MKKFIKVFALAIAVLCLGTLTACGNQLDFSVNMKTDSDQYETITSKAFGEAFGVSESIEEIDISGVKFSADVEVDLLKFLPIAMADVTLPGSELPEAMIAGVSVRAIVKVTENQQNEESIELALKATAKQNNEQIASAEVYVNNEGAFVNYKLNYGGITHEAKLKFPLEYVLDMVPSIPGEGPELMALSYESQAQDSALDMVLGLLGQDTVQFIMTAVGDIQAIMSGKSDTEIEVAVINGVNVFKIDESQGNNKLVVYLGSKENKPVSAKVELELDGIKVTACSEVFNGNISYPNFSGYVDATAQEQ